MRREGIIAKVKPLLVVLFTLALLATCCICAASASCASGVWNNFNYDQPASYWSSAARQYGGNGGVLDLVVAQAQDGYAALPFPFTGQGSIRGVSEKDLAEPYLSTLDSEGLRVILSVQPSGADVEDLIGIVLNRYGHHKCVIGVNVDMEWKQTGAPQHVSNGERDAWTAVISRYNPGLKLFLTYFKDYTYFPADDGKLVVMYDGLGDTQENIMARYGELARHFANVGIYTGYQSSRPPTASDEMILRAAPHTRYIIHAGDPNADPGASIAPAIDRPSFGLKSMGFDMADFKSKMGMPSMESPLSSFSSYNLPMPADTGSAGNKENIFDTALSGSLGEGFASKYNWDWPALLFAR